VTNSLASDGLSLLCLGSADRSWRSFFGVAEIHEAAQIRQALVRKGWSIVDAASLLGRSRQELRYRMRRHGIERPTWEGLLPCPDSQPVCPIECALSGPRLSQETLDSKQDRG
jgi:Bacterial regulatory protein, Fis family